VPGPASSVGHNYAQRNWRSSKKADAQDRAADWRLGHQEEMGIPVPSISADPFFSPQTRVQQSDFSIPALFGTRSCFFPILAALLVPMRHVATASVGLRGCSQPKRSNSFTRRPSYNDNSRCSIFRSGSQQRSSLPHSEPAEEERTF
jgi:hypothetical protein